MRSKYSISGGRFTNYIAINWYQYLTLCTGMLLITFTFDKCICKFVQWFKWVHLYTEASWSEFFCRIEMCTHHFLPEASIGLRVLSSPVCVCVCPSTFFVHAIPHLTFQLESSNLDQKIQQILFKVPIVFGVDWPWPSRSNLRPFKILFICIAFAFWNICETYIKTVVS